MDRIRKVISIYSLLLFMGVLILSCNRGKLSNRDYYKLKNSKIEFPQDMEQWGRLDSLKLSSPYKMLIFRDSSYCTPCYVKSLNDWQKFLSAVKPNRVSLVFFLAPKQDEYVSVKSVLNSRKYKWLVYVDTNNKFWTNNPQIPQDGIYHCMLLDKHNNVVIIGNPMKNKTIFKMIVEKLNKSINN